MRIFKALTRAMVAAALTTQASGDDKVERRWDTIATYRGTTPGMVHLPRDGRTPYFVYGGPNQLPVERMILEFDQEGQLTSIKDHSPNPILLDSRIHHEILVR